MRFTKINFDIYLEKEWDSIIENMSGSRHFFYWRHLKYNSAFTKVKNISFAIKEENKIVSIVALAINNNFKPKIFGFGNNYIPAPLFLIDINHSHKKKIYEFIFEEIFNIAKKNNIKNIKILSHPCSYQKSGPLLSSKNQFELILYGFKYIVHNTLIHALQCCTEIEMFNKCSKYHKKNIQYAKKKSMNFIIINKNTNNKFISIHFNNLKKFHFISAGRKTRSSKTWKVMEEQIYDGKSDLFCLEYNNVPVSYLYCGRYNNFVWGWTQVNLDIYEKELMPRHLIEWNAMLYYKSLGFRFYEIGERFLKQRNFKPSKKEITISDFKEKYGSDWYPKVIFEKSFKF